MVMLFGDSCEPAVWENAEMRQNEKREMNRNLSFMGDQVR
jgi:hypothetical protein